MVGIPFARMVIVLPPSVVVVVVAALTLGTLPPATTGIVGQRAVAHMYVAV